MNTPPIDQLIGDQHFECQPIRAVRATNFFPIGTAGYRNNFQKNASEGVALRGKVVQYLAVSISFALG